MAANTQTMTYGGNVPALTYNTTGLVNGDTQGKVFSGLLATTGSSTSNAGNYPITQGTLVCDANYMIVDFTAGTLAIGQADLKVIANPQTMTYGGTVPVLTYTATGLVNGDMASKVFSGSLATTGSSTSNTGSYPITQGTLISDGNYTIVEFTAGTLTIGQADLKVVANPQTMTYGGTVPALTYNTTGLVNGDTPGKVFSGLLATTGSSTSNAGNYPITQGTLVCDANYMIVDFTAGTLAIGQADLKVIANPQTMTYGGTVPVLTYTATGLVNGDMASKVFSGSLATTGSSTSNAANYPITEGTLVCDTNYTIVDFTAGTLTIGQADLKVVANPQTMTYGDMVPVLTYSSTGLVNGDTPGKVFSGSLATTGSSSSNVGNYPITQGTLVCDGNYMIVDFTAGTLTIGQADLKVVAKPQPMTYGGTVPVLTYTATGLVNGDTPGNVFSGTLATTGSSTSNVGNYPITQGTLVCDGNYTIVDFTPGSLAIGKAILNVVANPQMMTYGSMVPNLAGAYTITGFVNGDTLRVISGTPVLGTSATSSSPVGSYTITVDVSGLSAVNYGFAGQDGSLTVTKASLSVIANPQTMTYGAAVPTLTYSVAGLVNGDTPGSALSGSLATSGTSSSSRRLPHHAGDAHLV